MHLKHLIIPLYLAIFFASPATHSAQVSGTISTTDMRPIAGAIVTVFDASGLNSESVYSDALGGFSINTSFKGKVKVRARTPYFADKIQTITLQENTQKTLNIHIQKLEDPKALSQMQTASAFAAKLKFGDKHNARAFRSQCHFCHQIGNELTRKVRSEDEWVTVIDRMQSYGSVITNENEEVFKETLMRTFNGEPIKAIQTWDVSPELFTAVFKEWSVGNGGSYIHDVEVGVDGKLYGVDMGNDKIYALDPNSGQQETFNFPNSELALGGLFSGGIAPLGTFNAKHGPHSLQAGPNGKLWTTNSLATEIMSFDPKTQAFKFYPIKQDAIYPHTLRFDDQGILWFTLALSNQLGRFNPETEEFTLIDTPSHGVMRWLADAMLPSILEVASWFPKKDLQLALSHHKLSGEGYKIFNLPYGIDVSPVDGSIWYGKLYSSYIGHLNPETLEVEEINTPLKGPRRLRFDKSGILWIPSFEDGALMRYDPKTKLFKIYPLPTLAPGEYETPYALGIHPETQEIWITSNMSDRIFRFLPEEERFISYPSPTKVTFLRDIVFLEDGGVCSSNSNLPAYSIEGGLQKMLCIYPDANKTDVTSSDINKEGI